MPIVFRLLGPLALGSADRATGLSVPKIRCMLEVLLLEDAAGALGAEWRGMPCGGLGTMGCLSFHPRKVVTTGEGGAVTTNDA